MLTFDQFVNENHGELHESYSNLANILRGGRLSVRTIGIISAENPHGKKASPEKNRQNTLKLRKHLTQARYGYRPVKGKYGYAENSFVINNISKEDLMELGRRFEQDSVVFGRRVEDEDGYYGMDFEMIGTDTHNFDKTIGSNRVMINRADADDFYTKYHGRKFVIPFFGTEDLKSEEDDWEEIVSNDYSDTAWQGGKASPTKSKIIYRNIHTRKELSPEEYSLLKTRIGESVRTSGSTSWNYRGAIKDLIKRK